ncbi:uncharacterized protein LOC131857894 [Cryptomeria japonica]|uniref:uncharacterized protein LOC131857894 n=1 Tax=Cryptomeria japonica TaxID=3369 RepID=UPI0027DA643B|nr:uncharacterized protein LOC131857894 [Cryptomeria japonica]
MAGEFNAIIKLSEKKGGVMQLDPSSYLFWDSISTLHLIDIKSSNGLFTWNNRRVGECWIAERLDRFLLVSSSAQVSHSPSFKFQLMWLRDPTLHALVEQWWRKGRSAFGIAMFTFAKQLQFVKFQLKQWNRKGFGNIFQAKKAAQTVLNGITSEIKEQGLSEALLRKDDRALKALEEWELREEIY